MSLETEIRKLFLDNTDYTNPGQAVNQASALNALSSDLYTDSKRFIYELLQNADDSSQEGKAIKVWIKVFGNTLVVAHSGKPFTVRDLQGICNVNNGTKKSDLTKTGYKGIGFKSVFGQSDKVTIFTRNEFFRFDSTYSFEWKWEDSKIVWEQKNDREFQFPWQIIPIYTEIKEIPEPINQFLENEVINVATIIEMKNASETRQAVQDLSQNLNMFLFLKNISEINFEITDLVTININRSIKDKIILQKGNGSKVDWLINTISLTVPNDLKAILQDERNIPEKLLNADSIELSLAAKVGREGIVKLSNQEKLLYSYLPTSETRYNLPVIVNTSFLTTANREMLHADSKWNQWLFKIIAIEIFKWISDLVKTDTGFQAYQLIPKETSSTDELGKKLNEGIKYALKHIPFVISNEGNLLRIEETIVDFTHLSEEFFIGEEPIKKLINKDNPKQFAQKCDFFSEFKRLGSSYFDWKQLKALLTSKFFINNHTLPNNIELIKHLKKACESDQNHDISKDTLKKIPFIWDHKNHINYPHHVCFPTADDQNWNNPNSDLSFLHLDLQTWLFEDLESRHWLESLGVKEKTDITYINQIIIPNIDGYITKENSFQVVRDLFNLYHKGNLKEDLIRKLSRIKLLTQKGSLCPAEDCFLSDYYKPRLELEKTIENNDIFVNESYCSNTLEKDEWKRFFKMLGVQEGILTLSPDKLFRSELINHGFKGEYVNLFEVFKYSFSVDFFRGIKTLNYIQYTENNYKMAFKFWSDYIENYSPNDIGSFATAYWGYKHMSGGVYGDQVENYIPWFVNNVKCIPTLSGECMTASSVFLNTEEIKDISGNYLKVFNGPELSADWRKFFNFRTSFEVSDYLDLLSEISLDINGNAKNGNYKKIQSIYSKLLAQCVNWSSDDISKVEEWAKTGLLLNTKAQFTECKTLNYFLDGNESIFQDQYFFIKINAENKKSPNLEVFLKYFKIQILRQNEFELIHTREDECLDLKEKLENVVPYFRVWIENEESDDRTKKSLEKLRKKVEALNFFQAEDLKITYKGINFVKSVNIHFNKESVYVTTPWNSNSVLLRLSEILCNYFDLMGHDKKLDFLLRSNVNEIQKYFRQEEFAMSEELFENSYYVETETTPYTDFEVESNENDFSPMFHHVTKHDLSRRKYIEGRIPKAVSNVIEHLKKLPEYDCSHIHGIARSVISGITKNGNEITVVARPSDADKVLIFYESEFDVLEYVDAELWCEDGVTPPKQITLGQILKKAKINKIPIENIDIDDADLQTFLSGPKSEVLDYNAIPYGPHKIAKIVSSFANTNGGTLIFGLKAISPTSNKIVGLSADFYIANTTKKAISLLSPTPSVTYDWVNSGENSVFVIKTEKASNEILLENQKYIREGADSILENKSIDGKATISVSNYNKTIAIIIGIENYTHRVENQVPKVKYATSDAMKFKDVLINSMGLNEEDIYLYLDDQALQSNLKYDLQGLFRSLSKEDRLVFYYVGHGFHDGTTNFLSTYDMHPSNISNTAVSLRQILLDPLLASKCKNALIFIDACAQSFKNENERRQITNINEDEIVMLTHESPHFATFLSCQPGQSSYSSDILQNGIWTYHLVKALNGDVSEVLYNNKYITDILLMNYLSSCVSEYTKKELGYNQNPRALLDLSYDNIIAELKVL